MLLSFGGDDSTARIVGQDGVVLVLFREEASNALQAEGLYTLELFISTNMWNDELEDPGLAHGAPNHGIVIREDAPLHTIKVVEDPIMRDR